MEKEMIKKFQEKIDEVNAKGGFDKAEAALLFVKFKDNTGTGCLGGNADDRIRLVMHIINAVAKSFNTTDKEFCKYILSAINKNSKYIKSTTNVKWWEN